MSVGTAGEKGEEAVAGGADGAKYTNGEECDAEVSRGGGRARGPVRRYSSRREASTAAAWGVGPQPGGSCVVGGQMCGAGRVKGLHLNAGVDPRSL